MLPKIDYFWPINNIGYVNIEMKISSDGASIVARITYSLVCALSHINCVDRVDSSHNKCVFINNILIVRVQYAVAKINPRKA
jgi:hypothetical protein